MSPFAEKWKLSFPCLEYIITREKLLNMESEKQILKCQNVTYHPYWAVGGLISAQ